MTVWSARELRPLVGDLRQLASVRRVVLDDGAERGVRALLFSTGGGLDFTVLSDRSMDIGVVSWRGIPVSWQSPAGFAAPSLLNAESDSGTGFNRGFSGFLVTCGLDHIRFPAEGRPQHGRLPFTPASIKSYGEDWSGSVPALHCAGEVVQARYGGEGLRLSRRIEAPVGGSEIVLHDVVENVGANSVPQPMLYHFNLGYPAIAKGTTVELNGQMLIRPISLASADGLVRARSWPTTARKQATCTVRSPFGPSIRFTFETETLRHLQLWHDLRPNVGVLSIEPCTSERRQDDVVSNEAPLKPGETRTYRLLISFDDVSIGARSEGKD